MDLQTELTGMYAKIRIKTSGRGPFEGSMNILIQIVGVDPMLGLWKFKVEGGETAPIFGYFPTASIESFMQVTEEDYIEQRAEIIKRYQKHEADCPDCKDDDDKAREEAWYGSPEKILEFLSRGEKEGEGNG